MPKLNSFNVIGSLSTDPEIKTSQSGKTNVTFTLNVPSNTWDREARKSVECSCPMRFFVSGENANIAAKYKKGMSVLVNGYFVPKEYNGKCYVDYSVTGIGAVHVAGGSSNQQPSNQQHSQSYQPQQQQRPEPSNPIKKNGSVDGIDGDIPF